MKEFYEYRQFVAVSLGIVITIGVMIVMIVKQVKKKGYKGYKMEENTKLEQIHILI